MSWERYLMQIYKDTKLLNYYIKKYNLNNIIGDNIQDNYEFHVFEKGELICKMNEPVYYFHLLLDGKVKVFTMSEDGRILLHEFYDSFSNFGDIEILNNTNYRSNVEAIKKSLFMSFPINFIKLTCLDRTCFLKYLCVNLSERFEISSKKSSYNILYPLKNRLAGFILEHLTTETQPTIVLSSTYKEIAESLGTSYRHLYRSLNELKTSNIIKINGKQITILDINTLKMISREI
jgi:CRP-like cAMP-binding protein